MAQEVRAQTAAFATYNESEQALVITATLGYPSAIVDHVRIHPGEGIIGQAFVSGRPADRAGRRSNKRLRYQTNSFMVVPLVASGQCLAVIALTDRADGQAFESRDLASARLLAAPAALALARASRLREPRRADQGGDGRPGHRALQPPLFRDPNSGRSAARSTPAAGPGAADGRHRRLQAHQRHARASRRRPCVARRCQPACAEACGSSTCALAMAAKSSRS